MSKLPQHVAIIMDGNGRWATQRGLPRFEGHRRGAQSARQAIQYCLQQGISVLTLFAFGLENNARPISEVQFLFDLMLATLQKEATRFLSQGVRFRVIGDREKLSSTLQDAIAVVEEKTATQTKLQLNMAVNFSGQWDVVQATRRIVQAVQTGQLAVEDIQDTSFQSFLSLGALPPPDLLIRTGAVSRISNFLLFDLAYTELYFSSVMWPDFGTEHFDHALEDYAQRERRFGRVTASTTIEEVLV